MRIVIGSILVMIIYYGTLKWFRNKTPRFQLKYLWTYQLFAMSGFIVIGYLIVIIYREIKSYLWVTHPTYVNPIHFIPITLQHQVIRIPLEDQVDFDLDDTHNVHNKTIQRGASLAISKLIKVDTQKYSIPTAIDEIQPYLTPSANHVLKQIRMMNAYYPSSKIRELEVLRLVWERIQSKVNESVRLQLIDNLVYQLADCRVEDGSVHCCEGRIMRILQTLELIDQENLLTLRPMWAFRDEIAHKISLYRTKLIQKAPPIYQELEAKLEVNNHDRILWHRFNRCLIRNLERRFQKDYLQTHLLTRDELNDMTQVYYESLYSDLD